MEKDAEATLEVKEDAQAQKPEPTTEELMSKVSQLEVDLEAARREAKSAQKFVGETQKELAVQRGREDKISGLENRLQVVTEMMADLMDRGEEEPLEPSKKRRSEEYITRLKDTDTKQDKESQENARRQFTDTLMAYQKRTEALKLDEESEEYLEIQSLATRGDFKLADTKLKKMEKLQSEPKETEAERKERYDKEVEEKALEILREKYPGVLVSDTSVPSGATGSDTEFVKKFGLGELPVTKANADRYNRIKNSYG